MAQLPAIVFVLVAALASSRGDVQETAPYKPSGWKPSGPLFLLPPRSDASTLSFSNSFPSTALSDNQFNSPSRPLPPVSPTVFRPTSTSRKPNRKFPDPRNLPVDDTNDNRASIPTHQFTSKTSASTQSRLSASAVRQFPDAPGSQFADSGLSEHRNFPAYDTDNRANFATQQFISVAFSQNRPPATGVRRFPEAPNSQFADLDLSDYPGDQNGRRSPSSTKLNDDKTFLRNSQPALRTSQAVGDSDDFTRDFPPNTALVGKYLPPANRQFASAETMPSFAGTPTDEKPGDLSQHASPNLPDGYQTPPAVPGSSFASSPDSTSYRPVKEYGVPSSSAFGTNSQQNTPRVYFVVLPVLKQQETAKKQEVPTFPLKENTPGLLLETRNPQASQLSSPRRRHV